MLIDELGKKLTIEEVADFFDVKISTINSNYTLYGGVKFGRRILFFEKLIAARVKEEHTLQRAMPEIITQKNMDKMEQTMSSAPKHKKTKRNDDPFGVCPD